MLGQSGEQRQAVLPPVEGVAEEADLWWSRSWLSAFALHVTYLPGATCCCHTSSRVGMVSHPWTLLPACAQPLAQHCGLGKASVHSGRTWSNWTHRDASRTFTRHWAVHWSLLLRLPWRTLVCPCECQVWRWCSCLGCRGSDSTRYSGEIGRAHV